MSKSTSSDFDLIVVGGGVVGAFHAWFACKRGLRTLLIERNLTPRERVRARISAYARSQRHDHAASGSFYACGTNGVAIYKEVSRETGFPLNTLGTLYLSLTPGERAVLEEMRRIGPGHGYHGELLEPAEAVKLNPAVDPHAINGALFFADDMRIESRNFFEFLLPWMEDASRTRAPHGRRGRW